MATSWARIFLVYGIGVLAAAQMGIVAPLVPALRDDLGLSLGSVSLVVSVITLIGALFGPLAGGWSERTGHARALVIGVLVIGAAAALSAAAEDGHTLLAARTVAGIGYLVIVVAGPSLMATLAEPRHRPLTLSLWGTFVPVGIAAGGAIAAGFTNWRFVFAADVVVLAAILIAALLALPRRPAMRSAEKIPLAELRASAPLALAFFCFALLFLALASLLPVYLVDHRGVAADDAGRIGAVATVCGVAGSLLAGLLMNRGAAPRLLIAIGLVASTVMATLAFDETLPIMLAAAGFCLSFALGGLVPSAAFASVPLVAREPHAIGPINGVLAQAGSLGSLAGPPAMALWVDWSGWSTAPVMLLAVAALGATSAFLIRRA